MGNYLEEKEKYDRIKEIGVVWECKRNERKIFCTDRNGAVASDNFC